VRVTIDAAEVPPGTAKQVVVDRTKVAVVRIGDDVYAIGDICTHAEVSLSEGEIDAEERTIECWKHGSQFSLVTGEPISLPATRPEPVYRAGLDGDTIWVEVPS
jgi:3-phenylpropionate/trans-cinnamate dioxygenase ferredoxin subunit